MADRGYESIMGMIKEAKREFRMQGEYEVQWKADEIKEKEILPRSIDPAP